MINLNPITIPVSNTPVTPPPVGMYYLYFQPNGTLVKMDWNGTTENLARQLSTHTIQLVENFDILSIPSQQSIRIVRPVADLVEPGKTIQLQGSTRAVNDGIFQITGLTIIDIATSEGLDLSGVPEGTTELLDIEISEGALDVNLTADGKLHVPVQRTISHSLATAPAVVTFKNLQTGESGISIRHLTSQNEVTIQPDFPMPGDFLVAILG